MKFYFICVVILSFSYVFNSFICRRAVSPEAVGRAGARHEPHIIHSLRVARRMAGIAAAHARAQREGLPPAPFLVRAPLGALRSARRTAEDARHRHSAEHVQPEKPLKGSAVHEPPSMQPPPFPTLRVMLPSRH